MISLKIAGQILSTRIVCIVMMMLRKAAEFLAPVRLVLFEKSGSPYFPHLLIHLPAFSSAYLMA